MLLESYTKFYSNKNKDYRLRRIKYFKSPVLNMEREGFINLGYFDQDNDKPKDLVNLILKSRKIKSGHCVWRRFYDLWRLPYIEIFYRKQILDKYFTKRKIK